MNLVTLEDDYGQTFVTEWEQVGGFLRVTSIVNQPYVWRGIQESYVENNKLFRRGIIKKSRLLLRVLVDGYEVLESEMTWESGFVQMNFPCSKRFDNPKLRFNNSITQGVNSTITEGPCWAGSDEDPSCIWGEVDAFGEVSGEGSLSWLDVWA
jgi:hypothetical protein